VDSFDFNWQKQGKIIENQTDLFPEKTNVEFVKVINKKNLEVKVWERGAGPTLACGTGACAAAVISIINKKVESEVIISLPGGKLLVSWSKTDGNIYMSGEAVKVFEGQID
jgi:diaminopimelate epimerase